MIVDDELAIQKVLAKVIHNEKLEPVIAGSGEEALALVSREVFSLILMDINLSGLDGFETIQTIRRRGINTPIIILSARAEDYDALYGLGIGADDYVTKPFNPVLLGAKVKALIRRDQSSTVQQNQMLCCGPFQYNSLSMKLYKNEQEIVLSSKETSMMHFFLTHQNQVFSKAQLYEQIWGDPVVDESAVVVYINRLRSKIEENPKKPVHLQTVWGLGYKFCP